MMNKFKKFIASILAVATIGAMSTVAFADALVETEDYYQFYAEVNGTPKAGETFTVDVFVKTADGKSISLDYSDDWGGAGCFGSTGLRFDKNIVSVNNTPTYLFEGLSISEKLSATAYDSFVFTSDIEIPSGSKLATYQFTVKDGVESGTYTNTAVWVGGGASFNDDHMAFELYSSIDVKTAPDTVLVIKGEEVAAVTTATSAKGATTVTYSDDYTGERNLDGKYIVFMNANLQGTDVTKDTRFDITYDGTTKTFGATLFETLGMTGSGTLKAESYRFGVAFGTDVAPSDVSIEVK